MCSSAEATSALAGSKSGGRASSSGTGGLATAIAVLGWFASLVRGRMPKGLRDAGAYSLGYTAQTLAYLLFVTDRYPYADPTAMLDGVEPPPEHPVHLVGDPEDLRRSRLTVFFRLLLAIPHIIWLGLWAIAVFFTVIVQWFITLFARDAGGGAAPLPVEVRPLGAPRLRVHLPRRQPVPGIRR